jgi:hypothetical protein
VLERRHVVRQLERPLADRAVLFERQVAFVAEVDGA